MIAATRFEQTLLPHWEVVTGNWNACFTFLTSCGIRPGRAEVLCMVAQELLENAVKYGRFTDPSPAVDLLIEVSASRVRIEVTNPVSQDGEDLRQLVCAVHCAQQVNPETNAFATMMKDRVTQPAKSSAGLGLARIISDGGCALGIRFAGASKVCVSATQVLGDRVEDD